MNGNLKNPGFHNEAPDLSDLENGDLKYKIDFRNIYSSILTDWLGVESSAILGKKYNTLNIF